MSSTEIRILFFFGRCSVARTSKPRRRKLLFFPPWFLKKSTMRKIEGLLPYYYHKRLRFYFDLYGCIRCNRKDVLYACSGLCCSCQGMINERLRRSDKVMKQLYDCGPGLPSALFLKRLTTARVLLNDFRILREQSVLRIIRQRKHY